MPRISCGLVLGIFCAIGMIGSAFGASGEAEVREKLVLNSKNDTAAGAAMIVTAMQECAGRIAASGKSPLGRRPFEVLIRDAQDIVMTMKSADAQKVFANALGRIPPDAQVTLCSGLKLCPANADVDAAATKMLAAGTDFRVRTAATDLLAAHKYVAAHDKIALGLDPNGLPSVQIATCRALAVLSDKKSIPVLIKYMLSMPPGKGGRFIHEATTALRTLSGQTIVANPGEWKKWWDANQKDFAIDGSKSVEPDFNYELSEKQDLSYYEVPVVENRLVLVLDTSGSMNFGGKPSRLDSAKKEMKAFIKALPEKTLFNIVAFSTLVKRWRKDVPLLPANPVNKNDAYTFIDAQTAISGTQTTLAMEEALREIAMINGCETIYLVTDGNPNPWSPGITAEQQERVITWINQSLKIRINTIGIYTTVPADQKLIAASGQAEDLDKMKNFLYELASHNDGVYREVGKDGDNKVVKVDPKKEKQMKDKEDKEKAEKAAEKEKAEKEAAEKEKAGKDKDGEKKDEKKDDVKKDAVKPADDKEKEKEKPKDTKPKDE